jgi:phosphinothricin acetyltransferase
MAAVLIRPSTSADVATIAAIYFWHVRHGIATFEIDPPDEPEMGRRRDDVLAKGLPFLVAEHEGAVRGYAYASHFRPRPAYRFCVEDSVYVDPDATRRGLGRLLLAELCARCEAAGARQMLAVIGDSANGASIGVHRALGFVAVGTIAAAGWKFDRWLDVVVMQRGLGAAASTAPG